MVAHYLTGQGFERILKHEVALDWAIAYNNFLIVFFFSSDFLFIYLF